jgi:hypothetical protein
MSTAHRGEPKSEAELNRMLGEGDTPDLAARPVKLDTSHGVAYGAGSSVDGRTVYIDAKLYREVKAGKIGSRGLDPDEIIKAWIEHEHIEWAMNCGDNPVDSYGAAHAFATAAEHRSIKAAGGDPERYERDIRPALDRCIARYPDNPPKDLWCGPYLNVAFDTDDKKDSAKAKEILRAYRAQGVADARKVAKMELHYGISDVECRNCTMYECPGRDMSTCQIVSGLVRADRSCDRYEEKSNAKR